MLENSPVTSCAVLISDELVFEWTKWDMSLDVPVKVNSVTKSVLSTIIGIASEKEILNLYDPVSSFFPDVSMQDHFGSITVDHLLTMSSGLEWPGNRHLYESENWLSFILERTVKENPGQEMAYIEANSHLLSVILTETAGKPCSFFAAEELFKVIGIPSRQWDTDPQGYNTGGFGLSLSPMDMLKFGRLYLQNGRWGSQQVVREDWIELAVKPHLHTVRGQQRYGRHWWVNPESERLPFFYYAAGSGGQYIFVVPEKKMVCVFTGDYGRNGGTQPFTWFTRYLLRAFD
ncbi:serine hydrolase domain-containing protein [Alteribacter lacisalsi]|uniref:serine hydrolase domain-containing protein n=1 Tax=Alteribacter lacisalsi TaxID=2045244 RepID=UPI001374BA63|nr:serine hydrolase [Alteribacter lacisalsi]